MFLSLVLNKQTTTQLRNIQNRIIIRTFTIIIMLLLIIIKTTVIKIITVNKEDSDENYQNEENSGFCLKSTSNVINNILHVVVDLVSLLWTLKASIFWIAVSRSCKNTKPYPIFLVLITQKSFQNKNPLKVSETDMRYFVRIKFSRRFKKISQAVQKKIFGLMIAISSLQVWKLILSMEAVYLFQVWLNLAKWRWQKLTSNNYFW